MIPTAGVERTVNSLNVPRELLITTFHNNLYLYDLHRAILLWSASYYLTAVAIESWSVKCSPSSCGLTFPSFL